MRRTARTQVSLVLGTSTGGVGTHVAALTRGLLEIGWRVQVCGPIATDELFGFSRDGAEFTAVHIAGASRDPIAVATLRHVTRDSVIVHAHGLRAGTVAALAGRRPLVVTWHNQLLQAHGARRIVLVGAERLIARSASINLAASQDLADRVHELGGLDVRYAPVAVAVPPPSRTVEEVRNELGVAPGQLMILSVGRLHWQKAHDVLIAAAARWSPSEVVVVIAGDGALQESLAQQIEDLGAPVRLLGRRADVGDLLAASDIVVLASRWEARALAAQEALAASRPLVATAVGGMPELLGPDAVLIRPDDVDALDEAVRGLINSPARRTELATRGLARAATWPTENDTLAQVAAVYQELLGTDVDGQHSPASSG